MHFDLVGEFTDVETIATGCGIRELPRLRRLYGKGRWRKMKGVVRNRSGAAGSGSPNCTRMKHTASARKEFKRKRYLD
jgi:hypothetical protein